MRTLCLLAVWLIPALVSAQEKAAFETSFEDVHDRIWVGPDLWANPMEDWRVQGGRLECLSTGGERNVQLLVGEMGAKPGPLRLSVRLGVLQQGKEEGAAGFRIGIRDEIDDYRARLIYGKGLDVGATTDGALFIGKKKQVAAFAPKVLARGAELVLTAEPAGKDGHVLVVSLRDAEGMELASLQGEAGSLAGNVALVQNPGAGPGKGAKKKGGKKDGPGPRFWFDRWQVGGAALTLHPERRFGPVLWSTYTLSRGVLKMLAHMPPIGDQEERTVRLQVQKKDGSFSTLAEAKIEPNSRTAQFRVPDWNDKMDVAYRLAYTQTSKSGKKTEAYYPGTVRKDPAHDKKTLVVAAFTGNADYGFPNREIVRNLKHQDPDLLFFSGDQIYEYVGGFPLIRTPPDRAILNYLRKWYLVGLAFGDLLRDRPSVFLPDDHDVYQGNIWGNGGNPITLAEHDRGGYVQHRDMVEVVHRTQCGNLPDPYDPTPIQQDISVYYGPMVYGRVGFAVIADRMFKSGPKGTVTAWKGRPDHLKDPSFDVSKLDKPGLELLGKRQEKFLKEWAADWKGADMKCVLSQTIFCNLANYHGPNQEYLVADLDSGGWPQSGRNRALDLMRRGFALHLAGDQHLASIVHHGIEEPEDANWSFCVPSIANFYPRSWKPDKEGLPKKNRPAPGLPNTGDYLDGFRNHIRVLAIGNPESQYRKGRLPSLHDKSSGYGVVRFDRDKGTITMECWRLLVDVAHPKKGDQFPGWPRTIKMTDNYGRKPSGHLPTLEIAGMGNPVVQVVNEKTKEIEYTLRIAGTRFRPMVFGPGPYSVHVGELGTPRVRTLAGQRPASDEKVLKVVVPKKGV